MFFLPHGQAANWGASKEGSPIIGRDGSVIESTVLFIPVRSWSDGSPAPPPPTKPRCDDSFGVGRKGSKVTFGQKSATKKHEFYLAGSQSERQSLRLCTTNELESCRDMGMIRSGVLLIAVSWLSSPVPAEAQRAKAITEREIAYLKAGEEDQPPADPWSCVGCPGAAEYAKAMEFFASRKSRYDACLAAYAHLIKAAEAGHVGAFVNLGDCRQYNYPGLPTDWEQAFAWYRKAAERGDAEAQYRLGFHLLNQFRRTTDAGEWLKRAADQGHLKAMFLYAQMASSPPEKFSAMRRAAEAGSPEAMFRTGEMLLNGEGTPPDKAAALKWFQRIRDEKLELHDFFAKEDSDRVIPCALAPEVVPPDAAEATEAQRREHERLQGTCEDLVTTGRIPSNPETAHLCALFAESNVDAAIAYANGEATRPELDLALHFACASAGELAAAELSALVRRITDEMQGGKHQPFGLCDIATSGEHDAQCSQYFTEAARRERNNRLAAGTARWPASARRILERLRKTADIFIERKASIDNTPPAAGGHQAAREIEVVDAEEEALVSRALSLGNKIYREPDAAVATAVDRELNRSYQAARKRCDVDAHQEVSICPAPQALQEMERAWMPLRDTWIELEQELARGRVEPAVVDRAVRVDLTRDQAKYLRRICSLGRD